MTSPAVAKACANVALVKYWGKRESAGNLPAVGSISLTLGALTATARVSEAVQVRFSRAGEAIEGAAATQMAAYLDWLAASRGTDIRLAADIEVNFPVAAGLASSAAIYCAVATAAVSALGEKVDRRELSTLARRGSGSAARSVFGGLVEWRRGERPDGTDSDAVPLCEPDDWDLGMTVAILDLNPKKISSRDAMQRVAETSPLYAAWIEAQDQDLEEMRAAIKERDLQVVGRIMEENALRMHASIFAARPPIVYWKPATLAVIDAVWKMRTEGIEAYFTIDAGPQVKVLSRSVDLARVHERLLEVVGVSQVVESRAGSGVAMLEGRAPWR